jgi:hypothetical protein
MGGNPRGNQFGTNNRGLFETLAGDLLDAEIQPGMALG